MTQETVATDEGWTLGTEPIRDPELRRDVAGIIGRIAAAFGTDEDAEGPSSDVALAREHLDTAATLLTGTLRAGGAGDRAKGTTRDQVVDLLLDIRDVRGRLDQIHDAARHSAFARVRDAMGLLRGVATVEQMLDRGPVAAARLGFDRTFVSSIRDSYFVPRTCFIEGDSEWAQAVVRAGREQPRRLDRHLLETEMVRRRQPIRVPDAQNDPRVHKEIAEVSMSRSYVAAPVIVQDQVIGFVHADYFQQRKLVGPMDTDVLWMFAEAFGFAYERIAYGERIAALRTSFLDTMAIAEQTFASACDAELSFDSELGSAGGSARPAVASASTPAPRASRQGPAFAGRSELGDLLTRRELEVLGLMADGATNDGIASRLVISHGTAKTHVKHILRKLSAANRAEAVSRYFQMERRAEAAR